jgi:hypothetical protein
VADDSIWGYMARTVQSMNPNKIRLLRMLYAKSDVSPLIEEGLLYSQIAQLLGEMIDEGFVALSEGAPVLTDEGLAVLRTDEVTGTPRKDGGFIGPLNSARVDRLATDEIYLPVRRHSFF